MIASIHDDLFTRCALGVYLRAPGTRAHALLAMSHADTDAEGRRYVVLRDGNIDICAVYRVRTDGTVRRLKRWPTEVG